jgi:A/G-specific adenine glycosylase
MKALSTAQANKFREIIYSHYKKNKRELPYRSTNNPYHILVSEIMLQQTQVERVNEKYMLFIETFPDFKSLADAPVSDLLRVWQGLGYNRRALALQKTAQIITKNFDGNLPDSVEELVKLPGIGPYTAAAICAFAFNKPTTVIETNIRTVFIHFFFRNRNNVKDSDVLPLITKTLDKKDPREWYYALMDYGVMLKKELPNPSRRSSHYFKQSKFSGSNRQLRGKILKTLVAKESISVDELYTLDDKKKVHDNLIQLEKEGFLRRDKNKILLP